MALNTTIPEATSLTTWPPSWPMAAACQRCQLTSSFMCVRLRAKNLTALSHCASSSRLTLTKSIKKPSKLKTKIWSLPIACSKKKWPVVVQIGLPAKSRSGQLYHIDDGSPLKPKAERDTALNQLQLLKDVVMNPYSDPNAPNIPKQEVVDAADAVDEFLKLVRRK